MKTPAWPADQVERRALEHLIPNARNARTHSDAQVAQIAASMREWGWTNPVLVDEDGTVIAGHGRILAARVLGWSEAPVMVARGWTAAQKRAYMIADNRLAENAGWDAKLLTVEMQDLNAEGFDLGLIGFSDRDLESMMAPAVGDEEGIDEVSGDLPGAHALKDDMAFPSELPWNIPEFRRDMLADIPAGLDSWAGRDATPDDGKTNWLWQWRSDSLRGMPRERFMIGFYVDDTRFECLWDAPAEYVGKMLNLGCTVALSPNYSLWADQALAVQLWNTYRARWVGRYLQEAGIAVIPDVNWSLDASFEFCFLGIPVGAPAISVQLQTLNNPQEVVNAARGLGVALERLKPERVLVYGYTSARQVVEELGIADKAVIVENRVAKRRRVMEAGS
ncbi:UNVERIFIED_ORG: ParB-like nuclease family protein [Burkholderia sp. CF145]